MKAGSGAALQLRGCTKAFKGKGGLRQRMHEVEQQLAAVHRQMRRLKDDSRTIRGKVFALETYVRHGGEAVMLRWRYLVGRHAIWERDIQPSLDRFPAELQAWYRRANVASVILNVQERCLRYERSALQRLLEWLRAGEE